ncbi:ThuA domain-containing protein [Streptomyces aidingensis]|uniref:Glucose/arabinose dehydrogenase, beta-propeller fold n=1 Tax=Streptomyces aidingensis TaxID=910347 RepID=A0A1I1T5D3_9ACTN|nr:ThuA domain-containing protein [Streptomyces aidingensis]SFD53792.1 Glucose/arabinose dehydrogenase, beta-propeller fold [Streptomyces aidingensis]
MQLSRRLRLSAALTAVATAFTVAVTAPPAQAHDEFDVLVFSRTAGFRHDSIDEGIAAIRQLGAENHFSVTATEDPAQFTDANLAQYEAVVWLSTTGDVLDSAQQAAFERYIRAGGGYAGIHAASDTEYDWPWYGGLVGAYFDSHPHNQQATLTVEDPDHPSTAHLPDSWSRFDEWYNYRDNPRGDVHVLASLDESSYTGGTMDGDHPIAWCHAYDGGRSWYTGGGHTAESYSEPEFRQHLLGGILSVAGAAPAPECGGTAGPPEDPVFQQVALAKTGAEVGEPMSLTVLPDGGVLHTSRDGTVRHTDFAGNTRVAGRLDVYSHDEEGLQGIAADPGFAANRWVYLFYAPRLSTPDGGAPATGTPAEMAPFDGVNRLSRFTLNADHTLDPDSEVTLLDVPTNRGMCCHVGGDIDFDAAGNLYLTTGDDSNPFESDGYSPLDERSDSNPGYDAQRTSANSNDLRGKILRITPQPDGTYTIPEGNMFAPGTPDTRPEIYAMGFRNPFRMSVDDETGIVYLGDYGPDAGTADSERGPAGSVSFERVTGPGFYGWPYCDNFNNPYHEWVFPGGPSEGAYDCAGGPVNDSPNNTGITELPPSQAAWIPYAPGMEPPEFGQGSWSPMGGPVYRYDPDSPSTIKFPPQFDGQYFAGEFGRRWIRNIELDAAGGVAAINDFPWTGTQVMDMEFGDNGALYVLDYGTGWFNGDENAGLYRIEHVSGDDGRAPVAAVSADRTSGTAPLTVAFSSEGSSDPDGDPLGYSWDFGDGSPPSAEPHPTHTYTENGQYTATLTVSDGVHRGTASLPVTVGNTAPTVELRLPLDGRVFHWGDAVPFEVEVVDPEDGAIDCSRVRVSYVLGHDAHGHALGHTTGCSGVLEANTDGEHGGAANVFGVIDAEYTDNGVAGQGSLTGRDQSVLQPATRQAEHYSSAQGVTAVDSATAHGARAVGDIGDGNWIAFEPYNLTGIRSFSARVGAAAAGGRVEFRAGSATGPLLGEAAVPATGGTDTYTEIAAPLEPYTTSRPLYLVFRGSGGDLFRLDEFTLSTEEVPDPGPGANLAEGRPVTVSSVEGDDPGLAGALAVDGDPGTRWSSGFSDPQWIAVDLGASHDIDRVALHWETAYGSDYRIQVSEDGTTWTTVTTVTGGDGGTDDHTGLDATGRHLRINGTARGTAWGYSLWELTAWGG